MSTATPPPFGAPPERRRHRLLARALGAVCQAPPAVAALIIGAQLVASAVLLVALGGAGKVAPHWFYLPIVCAAARFGLPGGVATGLVAVLFQPLRERLQRSVDHLMYGERDDPYRLLAHALVPSHPGSRKPLTF